MDNLDEMRRIYDESVEGLKDVHTKEDLEAQRGKIEELKKRLLEIDPEFKSMMEMKKGRVRMRIGSDWLRRRRTGIKAAKSRVRSYESSIKSIDSWVAKHQLKAVSTKLICPICHGSDKGNRMNDEPFCMTCWHKLIPRSELKKYNRKYRRNWLKKRAKKK